MILKRLPLNTKGTDYIIGDIHGCYSNVMLKLKEISFDFENDRLISCGDIIDRGLENLECLVLLDESWFHMVRGNHEQMMIDCLVHGVRDGGMWHGNGGSWEINYTGIDAWAEYIDATVPFGIEIEREDGLMVGVVHAELGGLGWSSVFYHGELSHSSQMNLLWGIKNIGSGAYGDAHGVELLFVGHSVVNRQGGQWSQGEYKYWDHVKVVDSVVKVGNTVFTDHGIVFGEEVVLYKLDGSWV